MLKESRCVRENADIVGVEARDGRTVAVSNAETGERHSKDS